MRYGKKSSRFSTMIYYEDIGGIQVTDVPSRTEWCTRRKQFQISI